MSSLNRLDQRVAKALFGQFRALRPLQEGAIDALIDGRNLVLSAGTGSGKTEAVLAPLLSRYWLQSIRDDTLTILYIAPTKALVNDLERRLMIPLSNLGLRLGVRHGDRDDLRTANRPHVLITTPESLDVLLHRNDPALNTVCATVIDEVHLLYNTQRGLQLAILLRRLRQHIGNPLQWAALSATVGRLGDVRDFLFGPDETADLLAFPTQRPIDAYVTRMINASDLPALVGRLATQRPVKLLIFANSRRLCEQLVGILRGSSIKLPVFAHYSSLAPEVRQQTEAQFASAPGAVCIATSTLELGIDIGDIDAVLLWDVPSTIESFLQRIGRGNRRTPKANVVCLIPQDATNPVSTALRFLTLIEASRDGKLPLRSPFELFGAASQQFLSTISTNHGSYTRIADLTDLVAHLPHLDRPIVETILAEVAAQGYLQHHGFQNRYGADEGLYRLVDLRLIHGNFGAGTQMIDVRHGERVLGEVPIANLLRIQHGQYVRFAGAVWRVRRAIRDGFDLEPVTSGASVVDFTYPGGQRHLEAYLVDGVWQLIHRASLSAELLTASLRATLDTLLAEVRRYIKEDQIPFFEEAGGIRYLTFAGHLINRVITLWSGQQRCIVDDYSILSSHPIAWHLLPVHAQAYEPFFPQMVEPSSDQTLFQAMLPASLQSRELAQRWIRDATIEHVLKRLSGAKAVAVPSSVISQLVERTP